MSKLNGMEFHTIKDSKEFKNLIPIQNTTLIIETDYINAEDIWYLNTFASDLDKKGYKIKIEVKHESVLDVLELVWITTLWDTEFKK